MKTFAFIILHFLFLLSLEGQNKNAINLENESNDTSQLIEYRLNIPESIKIKNVAENDQDESYNIPWIVALIIGILSATINFWVAERMKKSNEKNIELQLENAKRITFSEFKATLATKNRQDWIDDLRNELSLLISQATMIKVEMALNNPNSVKVVPYFEKMNCSKAKIAMLINKDKPEQKNVIDSVFELVSICFINNKDEFDPKEFKRAEKKLLESSSELFGIHWTKIKNSLSEIG